MARLVVLMLLNMFLAGSPALARHDQDQRATPTEPARSQAARSALSTTLDRLVGVWDVEFEIIDQSGGVRRDLGAVEYRRILDGKAFQETWSSNAHSDEPRPFSTTIDFFDERQQLWTAVWM